MIILITGASHTGKTLLAQKLLEKFHIPSFSIDLLKMGLIRSKQTNLTPYEDNELTIYLWNIVKEIIKTATENNQNLIIEGSYIPYDWKNYFDDNTLSEIKYICLIMSTSYIKENFENIKKYACVIEKRLDDSDCNINDLIKDNEENLIACQRNNLNYILIDEKYEIDKIQI